MVAVLKTAGRKPIQVQILALASWDRFTCASEMNNPRTGLPLTDSWEGMHSCSARITREMHHHHGQQVLTSNPWIKSEIELAVATVSRIAGMERNRRGASQGADPEDFNLELRRGFASVGGWTFEARVQEGVFYDNADRAGAKVGGFDFCKFDVTYNLANLWDYCFGRRAIKDGKEVWEKEIRLRPHWAQAAEQFTHAGERPKKQSPTIVGEIQFGNWAMAFRDYLKVLDASQQAEIDLFIYLVPDGKLSGMMSAQTVNFDKATKYLREVERAMRVPSWIVGIDVEVGPWTGTLTEKVTQARGTRVARRQ